MTTKTILAAFLGFAVLSVSATPVMAAETQGLLKVLGGIHRGDDDGTGDLENQNAKLISGSSQVITGVSINASGTACTVSLYDTASEGGTSNANGVFENSAAANTGSTIIFDPPLRVLSGIMMVTDGNEDGITIYTQQSTP